MSNFNPNDPRVSGLVQELQNNRISRRQFLNRGATILGSLAAANGLLAACTLPAAPESAAAPTAASLPVSTAASQATPEATNAPSSAAPAAQSGVIIDYEGPGQGYLAVPDGSGAFPAVVVIQEWWGLDDHIKSVTDRFAGEGFIAIAPDLYHGRVATEPDEARKLAMEMEQDVALEEIQNAANYLISRDDSGPKKVAVIGFCMGGGLALQMAATGENIAVVAPFYGRPLDAETAAQVDVPVVGSYGEQDQSIPPDEVNAMAAQIKATGQTVDIKFYPAGHAFFNDTRDSYNAEAAQDAWQRTLAAFRSALG